MIMQDITSINFKTTVFEGPLDLLITLISKHKLNIMDIEISVLLEQFLLYLEEMQEANTEIAGEFMEMAARLIFMKSASLLPKHELEELKKELEGELIEYARCKEAAERLKRDYIGADIFVREAAGMPADKTYNCEHDAHILHETLIALYGKDKLRFLQPVSLKPIMAHKFVSVFTKIVYVLKKLRLKERVLVSELFDGQKRTEQVAIFLALLELSKREHISFSDDNSYLEII